MHPREDRYRGDVKRLDLGIPSNGKRGRYLEYLWENHEQSRSNSRMNTDGAVEITQVANGFIVRPNMGWMMEHDRGGRSWAGETKDYLVFRTLAELSEWLGAHFSHRAQVTQHDASHE